MRITFILLVALLLLVMPTVALAQEDGEGTPGGEEPPVFVETEDPEVAFELVVGFLSFVVAGAMEVLKRGPLRLLRNYVTISDEVYSGLLMALAAGLGIGLAWWAELDLFVQLGRPPVAELGYIAMGCLLAAGDVLAFEIIRGARTGNRLLEQYEMLKPYQMVSDRAAATGRASPEAIPQG